MLGRSALPYRALLCLGLLAWSFDAWAQEGGRPAAPTGRLQFVLTGQTARPHLAELLIVVGRLSESRRDLNANPQPRATPAEFYRAAAAAGVWPEGSGFETSFENAFLPVFRAQGDRAFPAVTVTLTERTNRVRVTLARGETPARTVQDLSDETVRRLCTTFYSTPTPRERCIVRVEPPLVSDHLLRQGNTTATAQFAWVRQPGFEVILHAALSAAGADRLGDAIEAAFRDTPRLRRSSFAHHEFSSSFVLDPSSAIMPVRPQSASIACDGRNIRPLAERLGWHSAPSASRAQLVPIVIADLAVGEVRLIAQDDRRLTAPRGLDCLDANVLPGLVHSLGVAALIAGPTVPVAGSDPPPTSPTPPGPVREVAAQVSGLLPDHPVRFHPAHSAHQAARAIPYTVGRRPITVLPAHLPALSEPQDPATDAEQWFLRPRVRNSWITDAISGDGTLLVVAVPKVADLTSQIVSRMREHRAPPEFLSVSERANQPSERLGHDLQRAPRSRGCNAMPICMAMTPFAIGVAALAADDKALLEPDNYLLGAGWTWLAAPGTNLPAAASVDDHEGAGLFTGSSFAAAVVAGLAEAVLGIAGGDSSDTQPFAVEAALLLAAASDLIPADEMVLLRSGTVPAADLVRYGRVNAARTRAVAEAGLMRTPVVVASGPQPEILWSSSRPEASARVSLAVNTAVHRHDGCKGRLIISAPLLDISTQFPPGQDPVLKVDGLLCLDPTRVLRIGPAATRDGQVATCGGAPLLDIVYRLEPDLSRSGGYGTSHLKERAPFAVVLRRVFLTGLAFRPAGYTDEAALCGPEWGRRPDFNCEIVLIDAEADADRACLQVLSEGRVVRGLSLDRDIYFGQFTRVPSP